MNKERKVTVTMLKDLIDAVALEDLLTPRLSRVLENGLKAVRDSEERARRAMEPHKDTPVTANNYRESRRSITRLDRAIACLVDEDPEAAAGELQKILGGDK